MRTWAVTATALLIALVAAAVAGLALFFRGGLGVRTEPSRLEESLALKARSFGLREFRGKVNPVVLSEQVLDAGRAHFADHCASCHANDGSGQTEIGLHLYPRAPDMRRAATQSLTDGELFAIIENGVRFTGMPGWGDQSEESQRASWSLVHFVRRLPKLTAAEKMQMETLNPKTSEERQEDQDDEKFLEGGELAPAKTGGHPSQHHH